MQMAANDLESLQSRLTDAEAKLAANRKAKSQSQARWREKLKLKRMGEQNAAAETETA